MTKEFSLGTILSVTTGVLVEQEGFGKVHELFDFFCPGIMTLGILAARDTVKQTVLSQCPELADAKAEGIGKDNWREWHDLMVERYGPTRTLTQKIIMPEDCE